MQHGTGSFVTSAGRSGTPDLTAGHTIGEYQVVGLLGRGGMGSVYEAVHPVIDKKVAIKLLHHEQCQNNESVARFVQEAKAVNRIGHPNIVDVFGFGTTEDGRAYLVMELLVGEPLAAWLSPSRAPGLSVQSTCDILIEVTHALEAAHAAGIIHRDLKPDNIFLATARNGQTIVKLLDFGIAKLGVGDTMSAPVDYTQPGVFVGTPKYIAPEQARGQPLDGSADVYQLGVVAFELFAGRPPFIGNDSVELVAKHITMQAPIPSDFNSVLPQAADEMCRQMLDKDPTRRPSVAAVRAMLEQIKVAPPPQRASSAANQRAKATEIIGNVAPPAPTSTEAVAKSSRGVPWWAFVVGGLGVLALGVYLFGSLLDNGDAGPPPAPQAQVQPPPPPPVASKPTVTPLPEPPPPAPPVVEPPAVEPPPAPPVPDQPAGSAAAPPDPGPIIDPPPPTTPKPPQQPKPHHTVTPHQPTHITPKDLPIEPPPPPPGKDTKPPKPVDNDDGIKSPFDKKK